MCKCLPGMEGNAFVQCNPIRDEVVTNPCHPSPCGPNSQCRAINGQGVCSCVPGYIGSPPTCRPECIQNSECLLNEACSNQKCQDPCIGTCGVGARCSVVNHSPICSCPSRYEGNPFVRCSPIGNLNTTLLLTSVANDIKCAFSVERPMDPIDPCRPSPCGPNAQCRPVGDSPSCSCLPEFIGSPPNCRPECVSNTECSNSLACINQKCKDPCPGLCGSNAECRVVSHSPMCVCIVGYEGDPFYQCNIRQMQPMEEVRPCQPSPCGSNAICREQNGAGSCQCLPEYMGNPYEGCRPECVLNTDCPSNRACLQSKCTDPCVGVCGQNAHCQTVNHAPTCTCHVGFSGDPFLYCSVVQEERKIVIHFSNTPSINLNSISATPTIYVNPCQPSPCGPNSHCRENNEQAVCSCLPTFIGSPPGCRPECILSSECPLDKACINNKCGDPCPNVCGTNAQCHVRNHSPICTCLNGFSGNPFASCSLPAPTPPQDPEFVDPCYPSPCGPNSQCRNSNGVPSCSCLSTYIGYPPNCRPECSINQECASNKACIREKCQDPCPGSCGISAHCTVRGHMPICTCFEGYVGDPFSSCQLAPRPPRNFLHLLFMNLVLIYTFTFFRIRTS